MLKISHFIASLVQIKLSINIMKNFTYITISNSNNCFFIIKVFIALYRYVRANIKRINSIFYLILSIAFSSCYRTKLICLTLFPRICKLRRKATMLSYALILMKGDKVVELAEILSNHLLLIK